MGQASFIARDPKSVTEGKLEELIPQLHGVTEWGIGADGEVTIEYDESTIGVENIEQALTGLGYEVQHLYDDPARGNATRSQNSVRGASGDSVGMARPFRGQSEEQQ